MIARAGAAVYCRMAMQKLRDFEAAVTRHALALAAEARAFREALALMRDDLDEQPLDD